MRPTLLRSPRHVRRINLYSCAVVGEMGRRTRSLCFTFQLIIRRCSAPFAPRHSARHCPTKQMIPRRRLQLRRSLGFNGRRANAAPPATAAYDENIKQLLNCFHLFDHNCTVKAAEEGAPPDQIQFIRPPPLPCRAPPVRARTKPGTDGKCFRRRKRN